MAITLKDVARESGFSVTTVSRALGGFDDVNEHTRAHIVQVARMLGYQPNLIARQLQSSRTDTIGLIIPSKTPHAEDDFFSTLLKGVTGVAARHYFDVLISPQLPGANDMDAYRKIAGGNRVDGLILARTFRNDPRIAYLKQIHHPFVVSGRASPDEPTDFPYIDVDSQAGLRMLVEHFIEYGHREIGLILPPPELAFTPYRLMGYRNGLEAAGLIFREDYVIHGDMRWEGGRQSALALLKQQPRLTAIIAANDLMAMGAMQAVTECGLRVGRDVSVGGFDDIPAARHAVPSLTTVRQPIREIGEQLAEMLLHLINGEEPNQNGILLTPQLIVRESSGRPRR